MLGAFTSDHISSGLPWKTPIQAQPYTLPQAALLPASQARGLELTNAERGIDHWEFETWCTNIWQDFFLRRCCFLSSRCSVFMAVDQPVKKNVDLFRVGTPGSVLLGEFGAPAVSETRSGRKYEIFKFVQGYSTEQKLAGRWFMALPM
jgi:hypothetical protein